MGLHCHVRIQVIQRAICLLAPVPTALVHSFDLFISTSRAFVLLCAWNRNKGINGREWMAALGTRVSGRGKQMRVGRVNLPLEGVGSHARP